MTPRRVCRAGCAAAEIAVRGRMLVRLTPVLVSSFAALLLAACPEPLQSGGAPLAADDLVETAEDTPVTVRPTFLLNNDAASGGKVLSVGGAVHGTVILTEDGVTFAPTADYFGDATFIYTMTDENGRAATAS